MSESKEKENIAKILKARRQERRISLEETHQKTKIPLKFLQAIEEEQIPEMNPVYLKGFLKIYCNFLGLNYQELLEKISEQIQKESKKESPLFADTQIKLKIWKAPSLKIIVIFLIVIIFISGLFIFGFKTRRTRIALRESKETENLKSPTSFPKTIEWPTPQAKSAIPAKTIKVRIRARQDCWLKATVDGKVVFQSVLKKGRFEVWEANKEIELSLGNAGGVELYVNEKPFST
ncbi:MAG: helix-turn-helix domain-containing protein, partial [Candidatus Omnitrophica bacterium]|nr:helix-turn-helix domain-containing protein [Candidatus Omnitrophota bacterium]